MIHGKEHESVDCILQTFVDGHGHGRDSVRCEFLFATASHPTSAPSGCGCVRIWWISGRGRIGVSELTEHIASRIETDEPSDYLRDVINAFMGWDWSAQERSLWRRGDETRTWATMPDPLHRRDDAAEMMPSGWRLTISQFEGAGWVVTAYRDRGRVSVYAQAPTEPRARTAAAIRAKGMGEG